MSINLSDYQLPHEMIGDEMKRQGVGVRELARRTGLDISNVSKYLRGHLSISLDTMFLMCKALQVLPTRYLEAVVVDSLRRWYEANGVKADDSIPFNEDLWPAGLFERLMSKGKSGV